MSQTRRAFLKQLGIVGGAGAALAAAPSIGGAVAADLMKPKPKKLPQVRPYDWMTANAWNEMVDRVNQLSEERS